MSMTDVGSHEANQSRDLVMLTEFEYEFSLIIISVMITKKATWRNRSAMCSSVGPQLPVYRLLGGCI